MQAGYVALTLAELPNPFADGHPTEVQSSDDAGVGE
jgi:hypothetical protein